MMPELVGSLIAAIYGGCMCFHKRKCRCFIEFYGTQG